MEEPQPTTPEKISVQIAEKTRTVKRSGNRQTEALKITGVNLDILSMTLGGRDFYESDESIFAGSMPDNAMDTTGCSQLQTTGTN